MHISSRQDVQIFDKLPTDPKAPSSDVVPVTGVDDGSVETPNVVDVESAQNLPFT